MRNWILYCLRRERVARSTSSAQSALEQSEADTTWEEVVLEVLALDVEVVRRRLLLTDGVYREISVQTEFVSETDVTTVDDEVSIVFVSCRDDALASITDGNWPSFAPCLGVNIAPGLWYFWILRHNASPTCGYQPYVPQDLWLHLVRAILRNSDRQNVQVESLHLIYFCLNKVSPRSTLCCSLAYIFSRLEALGIFRSLELFDSFDCF